MTTSSELTAKDFDACVDDIRTRFPKLSADDRFVLWFLRAYVTESETQAANAVAGGARDKGIDAILIDDAIRCVTVVQAKYRKTLGATTEKRADVISLAEVACQLSSQDQKGFAKYVNSADSLVAKHLEEAWERVTERNYKIWLYFFTLGNVSKSIRDDAETHVRAAPCNASIEIIDASRATILLRDYLDGVAPPIPALDLEMEQGSHVRVNGVAQRYDAENQVESWVFSMRGDAIAALHKYAGIRLFARNVRGFLGGNTAVNRGMIDTLMKEPDRFFYYNNGVTILCDEAKKESHQGKDILHVSNPQVINGQQTTRTLATNPDLAAKASVLVKVIQVAHRPNRPAEFDTLLSRIVAGTNWQNAIRPSDLMANDRIQIDLERSLRKLGYAYIRKRQTKAEARRAVGNKHAVYIQKEELAQIVAACQLDPTIARSAREKLFEEQLYKDIFITNDPYFYLTRYWVMREVLWAARGNKQRREARFLIAHFIWSHVGSAIQTDSRASALVEKCKRQDDDLVLPLNHAIDDAFVAAHKFYSANSGSGPEAVDIPTFFKSKRSSAKAFHSFFGAYPQKSKIEKQLQRAINALS